MRFQITVWISSIALTIGFSLESLHLTPRSELRVQFLLSEFHVIVNHAHTKIPSTYISILIWTETYTHFQSCFLIDSKMDLSFLRTI